MIFFFFTFIVSQHQQKLRVHRERVNIHAEVYTGNLDYFSQVGAKFLKFPC